MSIHPRISSADASGPPEDLEGGHGRDDLAGEDLERSDLVHISPPAYGGREAHARQTSQPLDDRPDVLPAITDVEAEHRRLLDIVVIALLALAVALQNVELVLHLRRRKQVAGVRVFGDEAERLLLAGAADHDRRVRPREALRRAKRALEHELLAHQT